MLKNYFSGARAFFAFFLPFFRHNNARFTKRNNDEYMAHRARLCAFRRNNDMRR